MTEIGHTHELLAADFETIEYAEIKLVKENPFEKLSGRIVGRWNTDIELRYRGHTYTVTDLSEWELERFQQATNLEKQMIQQEWNQ